MSPAAPAWAAARAHFRSLCALEDGVRATQLAALHAQDPALARYVAELLQADAAGQGGLDGAVDALRQDFERQFVLPATGQWQPEQRIGSGGMGEVWRARRDSEGFVQVAALKLLKRGMDSESLLARFLQERRILARLQHPSIARLLDGGVAGDGRPYFVMELVDGRPIDQHVDARDSSVAEVLRLVQHTCAAVDHAHRNLVVHRDLKPSNILVDTDGAPRLLDFGIAKLLAGDASAEQTDAQLRALTPAYAAPEQLLGLPVTTATDVFSLGLVLYRLLAGRLPPGRDLAGASREVAIGPCQAARRGGATPARARQLAALSRAMQADLDAVLVTALHEDPLRRHRSAAALADDLQRLLQGRPVSARADTLGYRCRRFVRRHRVGVAAASLALLALMVSLGAAVWQGRLASDALRQAQLQVQRAEAEFARAQAARDFLLQLFQHANPQRAGGDSRSSVRELLLSAEADLQSSLADQPLVQAELRAAIAVALSGFGEHAAALALLDRALARLDDGTASEPLAVALHARASVLAAQGELRQAEPIVDRALAMFAALPASARLRTSQRAAITTLALIYSGSGREAQALELRERDLQQRASELGADHPDLATAWYNLGVSNIQGERYAPALAALRETERIMAPDGVLASSRQVYLWSGLAMALAHVGDAGAAVRYAQRARALVTGPLAHRADLLALQHDVEAKVALLAGDMVTAERAGRAALATVPSNTGNGDLAVRAMPLLTVLLAGTRYDEAGTLSARALADSLPRRGPDHHISRHVRAAGSFAAWMQGGDRTALAALLQDVEALQSAPTRRHYAQAAAWLALALATEDPPQAARWAAEADAALAAIHGSGHYWRRSRSATLPEPLR